MRTCALRLPGTANFTRSFCALVPYQRETTAWSG